MKLKQKIQQFSALFILAGFLTVLTLNAVHIHHINIGKNGVSVNPIDAKAANHLVLSGSTILCSIHFAYSSISGFYDFNVNSDFLYNLNSKNFNIPDVSSRINKIFTKHYFLRAPPISYFS